MQKIILKLFVLLTPLISNAKGLETKNTVEEQLEDFHIFKTTLLECHSGMFDYSDSSALNLRFDNLKNELTSRPLRLIEQLSLYKKFVTQIKCIHSQVYHKKLLDYLAETKYSLPFGVYYVNNMLLSKDSFKLDNIEIYPNDPILSINDMPINSLKDSLFLYISSDGNNTTHKKQRLKHSFLYYYYLYRKNEANFRIEYIHNRDTTYAELEPEYTIKKKRKKPKFNGQIKYTLDTTNNYSYLQLPSPLPRSKKYRESLKNYIDTLSTLQIDNLILDLRNNVGGKSQKYFAGYLVNDNVYYRSGEFRTMHSATYKKHFVNKLKVQFLLSKVLAGKKSEQELFYSYIEPKTPYNGQLYVLINGNTASAASNLASVLKEWSNAIVVGEESGGGYKSMNTGGSILQLPNSKIRVTIRTLKYKINTKSEYLTDGVSPHVPIKEPSIFGSEKDPQLDYILEKIKQQ